MTKNPFGKTRDVENPYAIYSGTSEDLGYVEYRILKTYKLPKNEIGDRYTRWFVAGKSDATHGRWEYGDMYAKDIIFHYPLANCTHKWFKEYIFDLEDN